uniref:uncharacterized protein LOC122598816 n=1 Tax=Erigeron canadensis TaxID=72917 RepID=UPI001CB8C863|nr:uncharacterized protein LOC122598816 [Erigeron canadensis]
MGSLSPLVPLKRDSLLKSFSRPPYDNNGRFMILNKKKKIDYLQWISALAVFIFFIFLFQLFLPLSKEIDDGDFFFLKQDNNNLLLKKNDGLGFGENVKFMPTNKNTTNNTFGNRKPLLALVFAHLLVDPQQILMFSVASALREIGYQFQVYSLEDGPVQSIWNSIGVPVNIVDANDKRGITIDWLNYDGILVSSIAAKDVISSLLQEPFNSVPLIWSVNEKALAIRAMRYVSSSQVELIDDWKAIFNRATVTVFSNYALPMLYAAFDAGNYFVVPGSPSEACKVGNSAFIHKNVRVDMNVGLNEFVVGIVGSEFLYKGMWLEHAFVLKALLPLLNHFPIGDNSSPALKIMILSQDSTGNYSAAIEEIASNLKYPMDTVKHVALNQLDEDVGVLSIMDLVVYGSFLEELSFPDVLIRAMCLEKPIIAPDLSVINKRIDDGVNGHIFRKDNLEDLTRIMLQLVSEGKALSQARNIASTGKKTAKNMLALEVIQGYASLLENILFLPSEVAYPRTISEAPPDIKTEWQWLPFEAISDRRYVDRTLGINHFLNEAENRWNHTLKEERPGAIPDNDTFVYGLWEDERRNQMMKAKRMREDDELRDRSDQSRGKWEEVYKNAKKTDRSKNDLHERDDGELERTGQPLCIYEPYNGQGSWPFLHLKSLYRGIGLSTKSRRSRRDDIDAPSRLPLLNSPYYRNTLGDFGAFFAIANRIDRIHKNAWIGFLSWRATARKESLSDRAEIALLEDIEAQKHGDAVYFWVRVDKDPRSPIQQDFWSFCDSINAGNCKFSFSEALKKIYGIRNNSTVLPPMPTDGGTWSIMNSWAMPTKSFLEFVMFSRMFVDALDAQFYEEHQKSGLCYLSLSKDKHCYSRILEVLVNIWAYHSARRMVYIDPDTGTMKEQHDFKKRRGKMWIKWFGYSTLKAMDEDLAEEADSDHHPGRRWLWPSTGEVLWKGIYEKERMQSKKEKETKKQKTREKIQRIKNRTRQKVIGKYVKPPPENETNNVVAVERHFR